MNSRSALLDTDPPGRSPVAILDGAKLQI